MQDINSIAETEGKGGAVSALSEDQSMHEGFSEVFDWRPSVEKTDVMRTMEAIESMHSSFQIKRKLSNNSFVRWEK